MNKSATFARIVALITPLSMFGFFWLTFAQQTLAQQKPEKILPNTEPLKVSGDIASQMIDGIDKFLLKEIESNRKKRLENWQKAVVAAPIAKKPTALIDLMEEKRKRLAKILGAHDERVAFNDLTIVATTSNSGIFESTGQFKVVSIRWPTIGDMWAEGLLLQPEDAVKAHVVVIPDADQTPLQLAGLQDGSKTPALARILATHGCQVIVPTLVNRKLEKRNGRANLTSREFLYRPAFELGRHLIGYELQQVFAALDWFEKQGSTTNRLKIGVAGWGEGGMLTLYAAAIDKRIDAACVSGYFARRENIWSQPLDRNVFRVLLETGDSELAALSKAKKIIVDASQFPELTLPSQGGAPAAIKTPPPAEVEKEVVRAKYQLKIIGKNESDIVSFFPKKGEMNTAYSSATIDEFTVALGIKPMPDLAIRDAEKKVEFDNEVVQKRLIHQIDRHNQQLLAESAYVRKEFMKEVDTSSIEKFTKTIEPYREHFAKRVIGQFENKVVPAKPRTRLRYEKEKWIGYDVVLDVYPDVIAYGVLLVPRNIKPGEKRPVVVCQHGLEGRPKDTIEKDHPAYHDFAAKLAERGFITFAPQNIYIFRDRFRTLQRKANTLGKTLFSIMVPQHQQIVDWLKTLPYVDAKRIAFYGLSYGGKSAMRIPPLVSDYCLSICSADFNEWVWKNASSRSKYSYVWTGEYEIFEFDLGSTFNYAEMAALIAPRPFMVERGHFDGVGSDEAVGYEFGKVRHLYAARLGIPDRCEIEWFKGPHTINGKGTFDFLHRHLKWPKPKK